MGRTEAVEYCGFRVIKIWELQNDLAAGWPSVPSAHMSGLHAARHAQIRPAAGNLPRNVRWGFIAFPEALSSPSYECICVRTCVAGPLC